MSTGAQATQTEIIRAEHDSSANVQLKKVGTYGWDPDNLQWVRVATNADGELKVNLETADIEIGAVEIKDGSTDNRATVNTDGELRVNFGDSDMEGGGKVSVGTTAVEATFTGSTKSIIISADVANTGTLYIGKSNVTNAGANAIAFILPGESIIIDYDDASNAVYVVATASSQNFWKGALIV